MRGAWQRAWIIFSLLFSACGDNDPSLPVAVTVAAGPRQQAAACQRLELHGLVSGSARRVWWENADGPAVYIHQSGSASAWLRAPVDSVPTTLRLRLNAIDAAGQVHSDSLTIDVAAAPPEADLAAGMARDCIPFPHGVASGDPLPESVLLWTRIAVDDTATEMVPVNWEVASDPAFENIVQVGRVTAPRVDDFTVHVEVGGLSPHTTYYYRFIDRSGESSAIGRTRTAPRGAHDHLRFAVASCSSIYSGYFNAYRRIAERSDLDLTIHLGDYLYDFVDQDEQIRIPTPYPSEPGDLDGWRARHAYYLADPDLRRARAMHPWMMIWDNHDVEASAAPHYNGGVQAFREWNPIRVTASDHPEIIYRSARFGDLVDLVFIDVLLHRNQDTVPGTEAMSIMGDQQFGWLTDQLRSSTTVWRVMANQRLTGTVRINPIYSEFVGGGRRDIFDPGAWDGFPEDRQRLFTLLADETSGDNLVLSGDSHVSIALDLVEQPTLPGSPSVGVELLPTSISRGNFDETLTGLGLSSAFQESLLRAISGDTLRRNPHHAYLDLTRHGYGILDITRERITAEIWYSEILAHSEQEVLGKSLTVARSSNRWQRE